MDVLTDDLMLLLIYLVEYTWEFCTQPSTRPVSIKCKIALIMNQCMTINYEMDVLTDDLMLLLFSKFGWMYMRGLYSAEFWKYFYPLSPEILTVMKKTEKEF